MAGRVPDESFGSPAQQALLARGRAMFRLLGHDPRFTYYGRTVGLFSPSSGSSDLLCDLARLQGNAAYARVPDADMPALSAAFSERGLSVTRYARWTAGANGLLAARAMTAQRPLPDGITAYRIGPDTAPDILGQLAEVALACGVLPLSGAVLRGIDRPGTAFVALDRDGRGVACAATAGYLGPGKLEGGADGGECFWGMLATRPDMRGTGLSLVLGAMAMIDMHDRHGTTSFFTGIEPGNAASEAVCSRLGLAPDGASLLGVADPALVPGGRMTK